jgi:hypothetical protein
VSEIRVLRKLFGSDREEVTASWREIQSDSKLLSRFPWPAGMEVEAVMNNPPPLVCGKPNYKEARLGDFYGL